MMPSKKQLRCSIVKFCPKCEKRMKPRIEEDILSCPKCGLIAQREEKSEVNLIRDPPGSLKIMEAEKGLDALPTTTIDCSRCGNDVAFWWMLQTRSADEPTTQFYRCTKCTHTWRNYG
ncbi:MAG: transcription factor S [Candidatus Nitrosopolaris sp.]